MFAPKGAFHNEELSLFSSNVSIITTSLLIMLLDVSFFFLIAPSFGPDTFFTTELNETTFNISWAPLPTEKSNGIVVLYEANAELVATRGRSRRAVASSKGVNTTKNFAVFHDFLTCSQYSISVRAFTAVGPGPYGPATQLQTSSKQSVLAISEFQNLPLSRRQGVKHFL